VQKNYSNGFHRIQWQGGKWATDETKARRCMDYIADEKVLTIICNAVHYVFLSYA